VPVSPAGKHGSIGHAPLGDSDRGTLSGLKRLTVIQTAPPCSCHGKRQEGTRLALGELVSAGRGAVAHVGGPQLGSQLRERKQRGLLA